MKLLRILKRKGFRCFYSDPYFKLNKSVSGKKLIEKSDVRDEIIEKTEDTMTLVENYIDELDVTLDKERLKGTMRSLYTEAQDIEV